MLNVAMVVMSSSRHRRSGTVQTFKWSRARDARSLELQVSSSVRQVCHTNRAQVPIGTPPRTLQRYDWRVEYQA